VNKLDLNESWVFSTQLKRKPTSVTMWRRSEESCGCSDWVIGRLQEQLHTRQGEIDKLRHLNEQQIQQLHGQEHHHNEELAIFLRAVNRNPYLEIMEH
jgi:TolA-binding protein